MTGLTDGLAKEYGCTVGASPIPVIDTLGPDGGHENAVLLYPDQVQSLDCTLFAVRRELELCRAKGIRDHKGDLVFVGVIVFIGLIAIAYSLFRAFRKERRG